MVKKVSVFTKAVQVLGADMLVTIRNNFYLRNKYMKRYNAIEYIPPSMSFIYFSYKSNYFAKSN